MSKACVVYRIEHKESGLGPFEHRNAEGYQSDLVMRLTWHADPLDIPSFVEFCGARGFVIKGGNAELPPELVFGWARKDKMRQFLKEGTTVEDYGFVISAYKVVPECIFPDGQCLFEKAKAVMIQSVKEKDL